MMSILDEPLVIAPFGPYGCAAKVPQALVEFVWMQVQYNTIQWCHKYASVRWLVDTEQPEHLPQFSCTPAEKVCPEWPAPLPQLWTILTTTHSHWGQDRGMVHWQNSGCPPVELQCTVPHMLWRIQKRTRWMAPWLWDDQDRHPRHIGREKWYRCLNTSNSFKWGGVQVCADSDSQH